MIEGEGGGVVELGLEEGWGPVMCGGPWVAVMRVGLPASLTAISSTTDFPERESARARAYSTCTCRLV
jgi:hypothetical protein